MHVFYAFQVHGSSCARMLRPLASSRARQTPVLWIFNACAIYISFFSHWNMCHRAQFLRSTSRRSIWRTNIFTEVLVSWSVMWHWLLFFEMRSGTPIFGNLDRFWWEMGFAGIYPGFPGISQKHDVPSWSKLHWGIFKCYVWVLADNVLSINNGDLTVLHQQTWSVTWSVTWW